MICWTEYWYEGLFWLLLQYNIVELNISSLATLKIPAIENLEILGGHPKLFRVSLLWCVGK